MTADAPRVERTPYVARRGIRVMVLVIALRLGRIDVQEIGRMVLWLHWRYLRAPSASIELYILHMKGRK